jgi:branched-chain amino acid transport system permease protein
MDITALTSRRFLVPGLITLAVLATLPLYTPAYAVVILTDFLMYIILTVSWVIFSGYTGYISLASAAFFGVGIYISAVLGKTLPLPVVIGIGGLASFCVALITGAVTLRLRGIYFAIFTFGLVLLIQRFLLWLEMSIMGTRGRFVIVVSNNTIYLVMLGIFVAALLTAYFIQRSKFGLALQSIGANEEAAAHTGINVTRVKIITFAISASFMGAAGAIMATRWTYIDPYIAFSPLFSFMPVLMAIFGGMGQLYGPIIGAAIFTGLQEFLITQFPYYYMLIFGIILVVVILYLPNGVVGLMQRWRKGGKVRQHADT